METVILDTLGDEIGEPIQTFFNSQFQKTFFTEDGTIETTDPLTWIKYESNFFT